MASHRPGDAEFARLVRARLAPRLQGTVETDRVHRILYATDASIYRIEPHGVVFPKSEEDVLASVAFAREVGVPILPRGGGSSLAGQAVGEALVLDLSRYLDRILEIDPSAKTARVEPGVVLARLNAAASKHGLLFGPDPASASRATLGGMIANNATGTRSIVYRMTVDHLRGARVLRGDGVVDALDCDRPVAEGSPWARILDLARGNSDEIRARFPKIWRRVSGYDLLRVLEAGHPLPILAGSEGTLGLVLEAKLALVRPPPRRMLGILAFASLREACGAVPDILETGPSGVELLDRTLIRLAREAPNFRALADFIEGDPAGILVVEYSDETDAACEAGLARLASIARVREIRDGAGQGRVWELRRAGLDLLLSTRGKRKPLAFVEDCAVPVERLADFVVAFDDIMERNGTSAAHYGHASAGVLHCRPLIDLYDDADVERMARVSREVMDLVRSLGGAPSGEHGDGLSLSSYLGDFFGPDLLRCFREAKSLLDPGGIFNPGKILDAPGFTSSLRSRDVHPVEIPTRLDWTADGGFLGALRMCNGAGTCRKSDGVMCPSFPATRDERNVTRGRANLLLALAEGRASREATPDFEAEIEDALSLCLSCKACRFECPSRVDIAKAKAEFLYRRRAAHGPVRRLLDAAFSRPEHLLALRARISPWRAARPLRAADLDAALSATASARANGPPLLVFADTFSRLDDARPLLAAVRFLRRAGRTVEVLARGCCGRPAFSRGDLDQASEKGRDLLARILPKVRAGFRVVTLEPSCGSMLRDDLPDLLGKDAREVASALLALPEAIVASKPPAPSRDLGEVLHHAHCHERAAGEGTAWSRALASLGWRPRLLDAGCCGMAGAFGYEHPIVSRKIAEDRFVPGLRQARAAGIPLIATGTSCRDQAARFAGCDPVHPALLLDETAS